MKSLLVTVIGAVCLVGLVVPAQSQVQPSSDQYRLFDHTGQSVTLSQIVEAAQKADVVFVGEEHNDGVGHALQLQLFQQLIAKDKGARQIALSLEMFERDTQTVLDEYLAALITEKQLLSDSRPWNNYAQDYKPLVLEAKQNQIPVIAANAPRRYVNMVTRGGRATLEKLSPLAKSWIAPLPYPSASPAYAQKFGALMGGMAGTHSSNLLDSQALWDATMADSIARYLKTKPRPLVFHVSGKFHSEEKLGTVEQLLHLRPQTKICVVTVLSSPDFPQFDSKTQSDLGDFIILTDPKAKRSF